MTHYDAIIIGAGAMGSATAYHMGKAGQRVLLLEQFDLKHEHGSSQDHTRIIRYSYNQPAYIDLARASYPLWFDLEHESGETLYTRTGGIDFGLPSDARMQGIARSLADKQIAHELLTPTEAQSRFTQFRFSSEMQVIYQPDYGILAAAKGVAAHLRLAQDRYGVEVRANTPVTHITPSRDHVTVTTPAGTFEAGRLIITAGAWAGDVLAELGLSLPLKPMAVQLAYFETGKAYQADQMPIFIAWIDEFAPYGIPDWNGSGLKVALHGGPQVDHVSQIDYTPTQAAVERIRAFCDVHLPGAADHLKSTRICLYTMTPDEDFIIDRHPQYDNILYASPCSGHGYKFSALIGQIMTDLALKGATPHDISLFQAKRFQTT